MMWIVLGFILFTALAFAFYRLRQLRQPRRGNLGKIIDYSNHGNGKSARREGWLNYSASEAILEQRVGRKAAERLIISVLLSNPSKSRAWCADKALYDLERDQRL